MFIVDDRGPIRWLTINRPESKNSIPPAGWELLAEQWADFEDSAQRVLVVTGAGGNFCSGADLSSSDRSAAGAVDRLEAMASVSRAALGLHRLTKPTIAAVDGVAVGAGMNLALGCDITIASDRARFAEIFVQRGLTVDFGGIWLLPRLVGLQRAKELAMSGRIIDAAEAAAIGLVLETVPVPLLAGVVDAHAERFAAGAPVAQRITKWGLNGSSTMSFEEGLRYEEQGQAICLSSEDAAEGVASFLAKRRADFQGR
ncbi:MAG: enoyl-CoA hydratase-related protein [Acidimicrobiia bacterium]|nr:enoyl-CoA hydratase-related protein [Acidimicrobiia bacterium]